jgi:hypothetical protein
MILKLRERMHEWLDRYEGDASNRQLVEEAQQIMSLATAVLSSSAMILEGLLPGDLFDRLESDDMGEYLDALREARDFASGDGGSDE